MKIKSQKGYSILEIGIGLIIITIFLICSVSMLNGAFSNYRLIEQKNIALSYAIKAMENELLDEAVINLTDDPNQTVVMENTKSKKVSVTKIESNNMVITTTLEALPSKNGKDYEDSRVKLLTSSVEFYIKKNDPSSKRVIELQTLKIGGENDAN